jgi:hypothetical protein
MSHHISHDRGLMVVCLTENITLEDLQAVGGMIRQVESTYPVIPNRLIDLRAAKQVELSFDAVKALASERNSQVLRHAVRVAIVAPDNLHYGMARMFQSLSDNPSIHLHVFRDYEPACAWASPDDPVA